MSVACLMGPGGSDDVCIGVSLVGVRLIAILERLATFLTVGASYGVSAVEACLMDLLRLGEADSSSSVMSMTWLLTNFTLALPVFVLLVFALRGAGRSSGVSDGRERGAVWAPWSTDTPASPSSVGVIVAGVPS